MISSGTGKASPVSRPEQAGDGASEHYSTQAKQRATKELLKPHTNSIQKNVTAKLKWPEKEIK